YSVLYGRRAGCRQLSTATEGRLTTVAPSGPSSSAAATKNRSEMSTNVPASGTVPSGWRALCGCHHGTTSSTAIAPASARPASSPHEDGPCQVGQPSRPPPRAVSVTAASATACTPYVPSRAPRGREDSGPSTTTARALAAPGACVI